MVKLHLSGHQEPPIFWFCYFFENESSKGNMHNIKVCFKMFLEDLDKKVENTIQLTYI